MAGNQRRFKADKFANKKVVDDAYQSPQPNTDDAYTQPAYGSNGLIDWSPNAKQEHPKKEPDHPSDENVNVYHA
jgi:hypothetical protein